MLSMTISRAGERRLCKYKTISIPVIVHKYPKRTMVTNRKTAGSAELSVQIAWIKLSLKIVTKIKTV